MEMVRYCRYRVWLLRSGARGKSELSLQRAHSTSGYCHYFLTASRVDWRIYLVIPRLAVDVDFGRSGAHRKSRSRRENATGRVIISMQSLECRPHRATSSLFERQCCMKIWPGGFILNLSAEIPWGFANTRAVSQSSSRLRSVLDLWCPGLTSTSQADFLHFLRFLEFCPH